MNLVEPEFSGLGCMGRFPWPGAPLVLLLLVADACALFCKCMCSGSVLVMVVMFNALFFQMHCQGPCCDMPCRLLRQLQLQGV
jgi:hypothetical protein